MTTATFSRCSARHTGHLIEVIPQVTLSQMVAAFGQPDQGCCDIPAGYTGEEWTFEGPEGVRFTVYPRDGVLRIGGTTFDADDFKAWLIAATGWKPAPQAPAYGQLAQGF